MRMHGSALANSGAAALAAVVAFGSALSLGLAQPLTAQMSVELGPMVGSYLPLGHFRPLSAYTPELPTRPQELSGVAWGGQARIWIGSHFGAGAQAAVASSTSQVTPGCMTVPTCLPVNGTVSMSARVLTVSARVLYDLSSDPRAYRVWIGAGPALVRHGGAGYAPYGAPTDLGASLGAGADVRVSDGLRVSAGVSSVMYSFYVPPLPALRSGGGPVDYGSQADMLLQLGATWSVR